MDIAAHAVVTIDYELKNDAGEVLDTSKGKQPLTYLHGVGNLVPGLEKALEGKKPGDDLEVSLAPAEGYGDRDEKQIRNVPVRKLRAKKIEVGGTYPMLGDDGGGRLVKVLGLRGDYASVDANHPLAGKTLHFKVKVVEVRESTAEERAHGHVHGAGGHHH
jgi:FKBP-type peptidyl-prolyl cis-trans isomerase SlyD